MSSNMTASQIYALRLLYRAAERAHETLTISVELEASRRERIRLQLSDGLDAAARQFPEEIAG